MSEQQWEAAVSALAELLVPYLAAEDEEEAGLARP